MRRLALTCSFLGSLIAAGCAPEGPASLADHVAETGSPIVNGAQDTTHTAVVALLGNQSECSGTVVQVKGSNGYVLTAAHCCTAQDPPAYVVFANDYTQASASNTKYVIASSVKRDPNWNPNTNTHDFCMLQFSGATASTPVIPVMTPTTDNLAPGTQVDFVGYGVTGDPNNPASQNSLRLHKKGPIQQVDSLLVYYNESNSGAYPVNGGPCSGDSGGPALTTTGTLLVAAVTSAGDQTCTQFGLSGRVSVVSKSGGFVDQYLNDQPITPANDCVTCEQNASTGVCASATTACGNDQKCITLSQCLGNCTTQACVDTCNATAGPTAVSEYKAYVNCICNTGCPTQCATECGGATCGFTTATPTCDTCLEGKCCSQATACSNDATCTSCVTSANPPASCNTNTLVKGFYGCLQNNCATPCGISTSSSSSSSSGGTSSSSSGGTSTSSSTSSAGGGVGGGNTGTGGGNVGTGAGDNGAGGSGANSNNNQDSGCSVGVAGSETGSAASLAGMLLGLAIAASRRRRAS